MANQILQSSDLWDLEHYLTERRKEIDRKYDYRSSRISHVLGTFLREGRLDEEESARPAGRKAEIYSFSRQIPSGLECGMTWVLSAMA